MCIKIVIFLIIILKSVSSQVNNDEIVEKPLNIIQLESATKLRNELKEKLSPELVVTSESQAEVDAIRNEILNAVNRKQYKNDAQSSIPKMDKSGPLDKDPIVMSPLWDRINYSRKTIHELVAKPLEMEISKSSKFLGKFNLHSNSYRDVIDLVEVQEKLNFGYEKQVFVWRTIPRSLSGNKHLLLALTNSSLVMGKLVDGLFELVDELDLTDNGLNINGFEAFLHWNNKQGQSEGYAVVARNDELLWIRLGTGGTGEYDKLEIVWQWPIHKVIFKFRYFKHNNESLIFLTHKDAVYLDIYRFNLDNKEFSLVQNVRVSAPPKNIAMVEWKKQLLVAIPVANVTMFYRYSEKLSLVKTVPSKGVTSVTGFQAGGLCFFAIAGEEPQILRYRHNGLNKVEVQSKSYQIVRTYVPIAIHTFRDDVLLLVQFEVPFDSHTLTRIGTLRWNGEAFETFFNVPCYMEEVLHYNGVSCLIDGDKGTGLSGAVVLSKSNNVSIIVPRSDARSGLFDLKIEIRAAPHPKEEKLIDIQIMFDYFSSLKKYNDEVFENAKDAIKYAVLPDKPLDVTGSWTIGKLDAQKVVQVDKLVRKSEGSDTDLSLSKAQPWEPKALSSEDLLSVVNETAHHVLEVEGVLQRAVPKMESDKARNNPGQNLQLDRIRVENIFFEKINGIPKEDLVLRFEDLLNLTHPLEVHNLTVLSSFQGLVNGIDVNKDLVHPGSNVIPGKISFENLEVERLFSTKDINGGLLKAISREGNTITKISAEELTVEEDFVVSEINGIDWVSVSQQMIRRDLSPLNATLIVDGNVVIESDANIHSINGEPFVGNFVWDNDDEFITVTGRKEFRAPVVVVDIDMNEGKINGIPQNRLISLSGNAYLPDETVFGDNLELLQGLVVANTSSIEGPYMDKFLSNPTLKDEKLIHAACDFRNLKVEGKVIVNGRINGLDLRTELDKFVFMSENPMQIRGFKEFKTIQVDDLQTDLINGKDVKSYVTLDTEQMLQISEMSAKKIRFDTTVVRGLMDFVNVSELYENAIRLSGDQVTGAELHFASDEEDGNTPEGSIRAKNLIVQDFLGNFAVDQFIDQTNLKDFPGIIQGARVKVKELHLKGEFRGAPVINGQSLQEFDAFRWSKSRVQTVTAPVHIGNLINSDFQLTRLNSVGHRELTDGLNKINGFADNYKTLQLDDLHINSGAQFNFINDENMEKLLDSVIWLNTSNDLQQDFTFLDEVQVEDRVILKGLFNGQENFLSRVVWKDKAEGFKISGIVDFKKGLLVNGNFDAMNLNDIPVKDILTKSKPEIHGNLNLTGILNVHTTLKAPYWKLFGDLQASELSEFYRYDAEKDMHIITAEKVVFEAPAVIPKLIVDGGLNDYVKINDFLDEIQRIDNPNIFVNATKSSRKKMFFKDLQIDEVNGVDFKEFLTHSVVRLEGQETQRAISGKVFFSNAVEAASVDTSEAVVDRIFGISSQEWFNDSIPLDRDLIWEHPITMSSSEHTFQLIHTNELNGVPFNMFDISNRDLHISGDAIVHNMKISGQMSVVGFVNGIKVDAEERNSFKIIAPIQSVSRSTFDSIRVMNKLTIDGFVNGRNISYTIPINNGQDIHIDSPVSFTHLQTREFQNDHLINGMDFNSWYQNTLKYHDKAPQDVNGFWKVGQMTVKGAVFGDDLINNRKLKQSLENFQANRDFLEKYESQLQFAYYKMCSQIKDYFSSPLRVGCSFKHLENALQIAATGVSSVTVFEHLEIHYLIFSSGCTSHLLQWNSTDFRLVQVIPSGNVAKWTYIPSTSKAMHLVAVNKDFCPNVAINGVWAWDSQQRLVLLKQLTTGRLNDIHVNPLKRNFFYSLTTDRLQEIRVPDLDVTNEWMINGNHPESLRFLPPASNSLEVLVANGQQIHTFRINPSNRYKRHWLTFGTRSKRMEEKYRFVNEISLMNKTAFLKLAKEAIMKDKVHLMTQQMSSTDSSSFANESTISQNNSTEGPNVGGAIFDDIQDTIKDGIGKFSDPAVDLLRIFESKFDVAAILDEFERKLLASNPQEYSTNNNEEVGGALFDGIQDLTKDSTAKFIDVTAKIMTGLDKVVDLEQILRTSEDNNLGTDIHIGRNNFEDSFGGNESFSRNALVPSTGIGNGEVVALNVGAGHQTRTLFGVVSSRKAENGGDLIEIFENLFIDRPFQKISCYKPSSLIAWKMDQETLLIFLEDKRMIQIFVFRGMLGFKPYLNVPLPFPVDYLSTAVLPWAPCGGSSHFLLAVSQQSIEILKAETVGNCINEFIECNEY